MGSYGECWLGSLSVGSTKGYFDNGIMQLFRSSDKRSARCRVADLPSPLRNSRLYREDDDEKINVVYYSAPATLIRDRLELKGYTLETAKRAFVKRMKAEAKHYVTPTEGLEDYYSKRFELLRTLKVDDWLAKLREIKESSLSPQTSAGDSQNQSALKSYMLETDWYGFCGIDLFVPLRLALEICSAADDFVYDLSDLVSGGYFSTKEDFVALAGESAAGEFSSGSKIIILTEGRSDGWIMRESLNLLFPHLADYFTFMDFEAARVEGGAPQLAKIIRAFAGAGIVNKIIGLFDNDTAGNEACRSLKSIKLPGNFSVLTLPELKTLRKYPTVGPSGRRRMNVNGTAASIELYLGADVLREKGRLSPVQWSGYNHSTREYQGEVLGKDSIQKRFKEKLLRERGSTNLTQDADWRDLCAIFMSVFGAFHAFDKKHILSEQYEKLSRD